MRYFWIALGWVSVALGVIGAFLPLLPTTPFLLLAAWSFSQGSEKLHAWIMTHPKLSPPIINWQEHGAINRRVKVIATASMIAVFALAVVMNAPTWALATQGSILCVVAFFIWSRPEGSCSAADRAETTRSQTEARTEQEGQ